jgi:hypothetical protein
MLYGKIGDKENDILLIAGYISCFAMPLLGLFDMNNYFNIHFWLAVTWILTLTTYMAVVGRELFNHRKEFPREK